MDTLSLTKEARIYNGEKTISLTSGAGKTGQPLVKVRREGREPLPDHAGEWPLLSRSGGEKGLRVSGAGTLGVPLGGTRRVGGLLGVAGRLSGTVSPFRAEHGYFRQYDNL